MTIMSCYDDDGDDDSDLIRLWSCDGHDAMVVTMMMVMMVMTMTMMMIQNEYLL